MEEGLHFDQVNQQFFLHVHRRSPFSRQQVFETWHLNFDHNPQGSTQLHLLTSYWSRRLHRIPEMRFLVAAALAATSHHAVDYFLEPVATPPVGMKIQSTLIENGDGELN